MGDPPRAAIDPSAGCLPAAELHRLDWSDKDLD